MEVPRDDAKAHHYNDRMLVPGTALHRVVFRLDPPSCVCQDPLAWWLKWSGFFA